MNPQDPLEMNPETKRIAQALLLVHEGLRTTEYRCTAGHRTIGVGYNLDAHNGLPKDIIGKYVNGKLTISKEDALNLLDISMQDHWEHLFNRVPWVQNMDVWRQAAMLDLTFNMGIGSLMKFTNTLAFLLQSRYAEAAANLVKSKWATQVQKQRVTTITAIISNGTLTPEQKRDYSL